DACRGTEDQTASVRPRYGPALVRIMYGKRQLRTPSTPPERNCMKSFRLPTLLSWCVCVLAPWGFARCPAAQDPRLVAAIPASQESIRKTGADVGVAFRTLDGRAEWLFGADEPFHAASTMKIPVLIELLHQRQQVKLTLGDPL